MAWIFKPRIWFLLVAAVCAALLGYALYVQHMLFLEPCPLCVFQRMVFIWIGGISLLAFIHNPETRGYWAYSGLVTVGALVGSAIAGRHLWLQSLPPDRVPDCGMGLNYMLDTLPFSEVLSEVFYGSGECAEIDWSFLGLSMPGWTLLWYIGVAIATIVVLMKNSKAKV